MTADPRRGEIWLTDWSPGRGSEQMGVRPALIIQCDSANVNPHYPNTIIATISSAGRPLPFHIAIEPHAANGLRVASYVKCEHLLTIAKDRLERCLGVISDEEMHAVEQGIAKVIDLRLL